MSGKRVDLDAIQDGKNFEKAKLVIQDVDIDDAIAADKYSQDPNILAPSEKPKTPRIHVQDTGIEDAISQPRGDDSVITVTTDSAKRNIIAPEGKYSSKDIANAIKSAMKSQQSAKGMISVHNSQQASIPYIKPPSENPVHVGTPAPSQTLIESERAKQEDLEAAADMMPKTDAEKHVFWKTKLQTLRMRFRDITIPKEIADLHWREVRKIYYMQLDRVSINKNVDSYKLIMIVMFFILEYIGTRFIKVDIAGFSVHSIRSMHRYQQLLIELGEKDYSFIGENWPVEIRLGILVFVNAIIFVIAKMIFKYTGQDMSEEFFKLYNNLGNETVEIPDDVGMDAPGPGGGGDNGMMGILGNILGAFGGGGGGGGGGGINLGGLFGGGNTKTDKAKTSSHSGPASGAATEDGESRVPPARYRRKKKKNAAAE
jgi:hypothetical protein